MRCAICGADWDKCIGECQDWITKKQKVEYLRMVEKLSHNIDEEIERKKLKEVDHGNITSNNRENADS